MGELQPSSDPIRSSSAGQTAIQSGASILLAVLWLALTAIQYAGTLQRTAAQTERVSGVGPLADVDLSPWYAALLGATLLFAAVRGRARRRRKAVGNRTS